MIRFIESRAFRATFMLLTSAAISSVALAQLPAGAPAGAMGMCKDGTYSMDKAKKGACSGHKGVKTWYATTAAAKPTTAAPAPTAAPATAMAAPVVKPTKTSAAPVTAAPAMAPPVASSQAKISRTSKTAAPGGGPGLVWVNTDTKVYHCQNSQFYGKTKKGQYMTEAAAKTAGSRADHGKACS